MRSSSILFVSVLEKLETIRPEHGGRQFENLNFISFAQSRFTEEQRGSCSKSTILIKKYYGCFDLIWLSDAKWQTSTLKQKSINVLSCCAVVLRFLILTIYNIWVQSKIGVSYSYFIQDIQVILPFTNQCHRLCMKKC